MDSPSIVIVGNGPSLLGANLGEAIDAHQYVLRCNDYALNGYCRDAGRRTTHWGIGVWAGQLDKLEATGMLPYRGGIELWAVTSRGKDPATSPTWGRLCTQIDPQRTVRIGYGSLGQSVTDQLFKHRTARGSRVWPTTGLMAICEAIRRWPDAVVDVVGFWIGGQDNGHYYDPAINVITSAACHNYVAERALIDKWAGEGKVQRL